MPKFSTLFFLIMPKFSKTIFSKTPKISTSKHLNAEIHSMLIQLCSIMAEVHIQIPFGP